MTAAGWVALIVIATTATAYILGYLVGSEKR